MQNNPDYRPSLPFEFHVSRAARGKYKLNDTLFATDGRIIFADFRAVRSFVYNINQTRTPQNHLYAGEVNAAGLIDEVYHLVIRRFEQKVDATAFQSLEKELMTGPHATQFGALMHDFTEKFPPSALYRDGLHASDYLSGATGSRTHMSVALEECLMLYLANINPAKTKMKELFDITHLEEPEFFESFNGMVDEFFKRQPPFGKDKTDLLSLLKAPMKAAPSDLNGQLDFILEHWKDMLPASFTIKLLKGQDLMREDVMLGAAGGPPPTMAPGYKGGIEGDEGFTIGKSGYRYASESVRDYEDYERFTSDTDWMPHVVLLAKNTYVWLDQLSKEYQREIRRLDQVPDEELDRIASRHINGLWLIGIWERSVASRRIKHIMGNTDAVSSAYSLYDYEIAAGLGGEEAFHNLNHRARERGIRLAGDMVPNHTGIYSRWITEHPDYFIQADHPPFPGYSFTGENLSPDPAVQVRLEDGYYSQQDAAVVFQHIDNHSGRERYIYHGNDGTMMPWNDTAQLDFLKQEVREAVIQKIFDVARRFSIIRFDAAMTLAKKHFSRLWYPRPGTGGDIASRADYALPQEAFDELFPEEFWREVVDRMNRELPDTLLLAEAFWFMEGYFVRTLGMHRVYNSAFMHMLKNEENEKYRDLITNTLEFEPEILKRYVNFMSNPDEETAIRQFGTGDKYFGICVLMATLPGLPMFGHGQVEGFTEKYGMEYQRAYYNESPDKWLVEKHEREVFPLTARRYLFSEIAHFNFYDVIDPHGHVNENVMAYTNLFRQEKCLVLFNNKYEGATGNILLSAPKLNRTTGTTQVLSLGHALHINSDRNVFCIFREHISGLEYLRSGEELHRYGFHWGLQGFEYRVFLDFREEYDHDGSLGQLHGILAGSGTPSIDEALEKLRLQEVHEAFAKIFDDDCVQPLIVEMLGQGPSGSGPNGFDPSISCFESFIQVARSYTKMPLAPSQSVAAFSGNLESAAGAIRFLVNYQRAIDVFLKRNRITSLENLLMAGSEHLYRDNLVFLLAHMALSATRPQHKEMDIDLEKDGLQSGLGQPPEQQQHALDAEPGKDVLQGEQGQVSMGQPMYGIADTLKLHHPMKKMLNRSGRDMQGISRDLILLKILQQADGENVFGLTGTKPAGTWLNDSVVQLLNDEPVREYLGVNFYEGTWFYSKESFEDLLQWLFTVSFFNAFRAGSEPSQSMLESAVKYLLYLRSASERSEYKLEKLITALRPNGA